jgi:hypothetical protein
MSHDLKPSLLNPFSRVQSLLCGLPGWVLRSALWYTVSDHGLFFPVNATLLVPRLSISSIPVLDAV